MSYYYPPQPPQGPPPPQNYYKPQPPPGNPPPQNYYHPQPPPGPPPPQNYYQPQPPPGNPPPQNYYQPQPPPGNPPPQNQYQPHPPPGNPPPPSSQGLYPGMSGPQAPPPSSYQPQQPQQPPAGKGPQQGGGAGPAPGRGPQQMIDINSKTMIFPFFVPYVKSEKVPGPTLESHDKKSYVQIDGYPENGGMAPPLLGSFNMPGPNGPVYSIPLPTLGFNPNADVDLLAAAMKGTGTRDKVVIKVVGNRTRHERLIIAAKYKERFGKELDKELARETSGNYRDLLLALFKPLDVLLAEIVHGAVVGIGTRDSQLIDIVTQFTGPEMIALKDTYFRMYKKQMAADISGDTSGSYRKVLLTCVDGTRAPRGKLESLTTAQQVANRFYRAGEGRLGTDDAAYIEILTGYSAEFLQVVSTEYMKSHGKYLVDAIKSETSFNYREALIAVASTRGQHFARRIKDATRGVGTRDTLLVNIFAILEKPDLKAAALAFEPMFGEQLPRNVASDTSGNYRDLLLELLR